MLKLRVPRDDEAEPLSGLCLRSKAVHGYDAAFMEACRAELMVKPAADGRMMVAVDDGTPVGFAEISVAGDACELDKLFVEPSHLGKGVGRLLLDWAKEKAVAVGARAMFIDSDPGARDFYLRMGAVEIGQVSSASIAGRFLPRLRIDL
ncbi:acetyltransferase (GNAT) family protein [Pseudaminobacter salicylatoxidans]|uniref:Acetyltransferase (GNAT) family protein n=1 Tax=Pseudaminobacter salicylatoxidans TaxID=93369 RepID=A0A316C4Q5_PSESE|nr:GNAT family N-acetyltransferase [Pseudaminobacter salicylatoxidans]PWJ80979.1 acetyltransferase (GNAT) family protein [Pseudaminobacter salicylatoxidans]